MSSRKERKKRKKGTWWKILLALLLVIGVSIGAYVFSIYHDAKQTVSKEIHNSVNPLIPSQLKRNLKIRKPCMSYLWESMSALEIKAAQMP